MINYTNLTILMATLIVLLIASIVFVNLDDIKGFFIGVFKKVRVSQKLKKFAIDHDFPLLSDVVLQVGEDKAIKIDHIMIGNKYIYVIGAKCYYGYLSAKAIDEKWLLYQGNKLKHINNPLKNNAVRIKALAKLLNNSLDDFVNIIYLSKPVVACKIESDNNKEFVIFEEDFNKFIEIYERQCQLNEFSIKSIENAAKKIFDYHQRSIINFKELN